MKILCKIFGHKPSVYGERGWWSPGQEYGRLKFFHTDGIGRVHAQVYAECARCEKEFRVARVHLPRTEEDL